MNGADDGIRTRPRPHCLLCGAAGQVVHAAQRDRLFSAPGEWTLKRCTSRGCDLVWLDPMPAEEDLGKAYASYYTHAERGDGRPPGLLKRAYLALKGAYLSRRYGYRFDGGTLRAGVLGRLLPLLPLRRLQADDEVRFLPAAPGCRLLDVGCGSGEWLASMRTLGWEVAGVDFDPNAVLAARRRGLDVGCGSLEDQRFADAGFDAITLHHVIEHVPDPVRTLRECARILKPGGRLVLATPNPASLGHRLFGPDWRGLEPPRHLHLFSIASLGQALSAAGLRPLATHAQLADSILYESFLLRLGRRGPFPRPRRSEPAWLAARALAALELLLVRWRPALADCVTLVAVR